MNSLACMFNFLFIFPSIQDIFAWVARRSYYGKFEMVCVNRPFDVLPLVNIRKISLSLSSFHSSSPFYTLDPGKSSIQSISTAVQPSSDDFSISMLLLLLLSHFSRVLLCATLQTAAHQAPPSLGFSRQEYWSGLPFPSPSISIFLWNCVITATKTTPQTLSLRARELNCRYCFRDHLNALFSLLFDFIQCFVYCMSIEFLFYSEEMSRTD